MMAPRYHPAIKVVSPVRKKLKVKTVFNILGPMLNPAGVPYAVIGVYHGNIVCSFTKYQNYMQLVHLFAFIALLVSI